MKPAILASCVALALAGCGGGESNDAAKSTESPGAAHIMWHTFVDVLGGEPDAEELAPRADFEAAGIGFQHPSLLRRSHEQQEDGNRSWSFEHGMFELQLYAPKFALRGEDYLAMLGGIFEGGRTMDAEAPGPGRTETLCGHRITATRLRIKIMGDWSEQQAFDLPAPDGESRLLIFDDEPVDGRPSAVAAATWTAVLDSLRCDPEFVLPAPDTEEDADDGDAETVADPPDRGSTEPDPGAPEATAAPRDAEPR